MQTFRRTAWWLSMLLAGVAVVTGVRVAAMSAGPVQSTLFPIALSVGAVLVVGLNIDHRVDVGRWYRSSDVTRVRVAVVMLGDLALVLLALQAWSVGAALTLATAAIYSHNIELGNFGHRREPGSDSRSDSAKPGVSGVR